MIVPKEDNGRDGNSPGSNVVRLPAGTSEEDGSNDGQLVEDIVVSSNILFDKEGGLREGASEACVPLYTGSKDSDGDNPTVVGCIKGAELPVGSKDKGLVDLDLLGKYVGWEKEEGLTDGLIEGEEDDSGDGAKAGGLVDLNIIGKSVGCGGDEDDSGDDAKDEGLVDLNLIGKYVGGGERVGKEDFIEGDKDDSGDGAEV